MSMKVESKLDRDLHHAAATGSSKMLQKILDTGKVHVDCQDQDGISALMLATANNRLNCVKILLQESADPKLKSKDGTSAIFLACRCGYGPILSLLLEALSSDKDLLLLSRNDGITPLIMASAMNHDVCVDVLLAFGTDPNEESKIGSTPLFHACLRGHLKAARRLLCDSRINLRVLRNGETCLHAAAISGNPQLVELLLDSKADPLLANVGGQTPLDLLIMFINYGNISLSPNLLQVLNLLKPSSILPCDETSVQVTMVHPSPRSPAFNGNAISSRSPEIPSEELQRIRKLVRIYCPFNYNHCSKELRNCSTPSSTKPGKDQGSIKRNGTLASKMTSRSVGSSPQRNGKNNHVRFTPDAEAAASETTQKSKDKRRFSLWEPTVATIQRCQCKLLTIEELLSQRKKSPKKIFLHEDK